MPHFIIDCNEHILEIHPPTDLMKVVYETALATGLFAPEEIKVRIKSYEHYAVADTKNDFIHVFGYIMEGRNEVQKKELSRKIIEQLTGLFPEVPVISMNVVDFEKSTYCNRTMR